MRLRFLIVILLGLLFVPAAYGQETTPEPADISAAQAVEAANRAEAAAQRAEAAALDAAQTATDAQDAAGSAMDLAFNLLGLFEALSFVVTVVGGATALFGVTRLIAAQGELEESRKRFEQEMQTARTRLETETAEKQAELKALREEVKRNTDNATLALSYLPLGERQYKFRDFTGALEIYQRALRLDSDNPIIHLRLGYVYTQSGKLDEAEYHLKQALEIEKEFAPALAALGYVYRRIGEKMPEGVQRDAVLNEAERNLLRALTISPKLVDDDGESWWGSLGGLYRRRNQVDEAIRAYGMAAEVMPQSSYAFSNLALLYMQKNERKRMVETYHKVEELAVGEVQADPDNYWACADLLTARLALNKLNQAEEALRLVFTTAPVESPYALESLMDTLGRLSDVLEAEQARNVRNYIDRIRTFSEEQQAAFRAAQAEQPTADAETPVTGD